MSPKFLTTVRIQLGYYGIFFLILADNIGNILLLIILGLGFETTGHVVLVVSISGQFSEFGSDRCGAGFDALRLSPLEPMHASDIICKLRWYGGQTLFMLSQCSSKSKRVCGSVKRSQDCSSGCCMYRPLSVVFEACSNSRSLCQPHTVYRILLVILGIANLLPYRSLPIPPMVLVDPYPYRNIR